MSKELTVTEQHKKIIENLEGLDRLLLGLNAYGSLDLVDYKLITSYLRDAFNYKFIDDEEEK